MKTKTLRKILGLFIILAIAIGLCAFAACGGDEDSPSGSTDTGSTGGTGSTDTGSTGGTGSTGVAYTFEAEFVDLHDITGAAASASISEGDMIKTANDATGASNGYYVTAINNSSGVDLTFTITASAATTAEMTLIIRSDSGERTMESGYLDITVNNNAVTYTSTTLKAETTTVKDGLNNTSVPLFQEVTIGNISLNSGDNTIVLSFNKNVPSTSSVINFDFDAMVLKTDSATLSWTEGAYHDQDSWEDFYSDF